MQEQARKIRNKVKENSLEEALELLNAFTERKRQNDEVILLQSRLSEVGARERQGILSFQEGLQERNKLRLAILDIVRIVEATHKVITSFSLAEPFSMKTEIQLNGKWIDKADNDIVFFQQRKDKVVGIYDFAQHSKVGFYYGQIKGDVLEYKWKWFEKEMSGYGQMIISPNRLSGSWWYDNYQEDLYHVSYDYLNDQMPRWLDYKDFKEIWYHSVMQK